MDSIIEIELRELTDYKDLNPDNAENTPQLEQKKNRLLSEKKQSQIKTWLSGKESYLNDSSNQEYEHRGSLTSLDKTEVQPFTTENLKLLTEQFNLQEENIISVSQQDIKEEAADIITDNDAEETKEKKGFGRGICRWIIKNPHLSIPLALSLLACSTASLGLGVAIGIIAYRKNTQTEPTTPPYFEKKKECNPKRTRTLYLYNNQSYMESGELNNKTYIQKDYLTILINKICENNNKTIIEYYISRGKSIRYNIDIKCKSEIELTDGPHEIKIAATSNKDGDLIQEDTVIDLKKTDKSIYIKQINKPNNTFITKTKKPKKHSKFTKCPSFIVDKFKDSCDE